MARLAFVEEIAQVACNSLRLELIKWPRGTELRLGADEF